MSDIIIDPTKGSLTVKIAVTTPQVVGYQITVFDSDGNTELEHYLSDSQTNNPFSQVLPKSASSYVGCFVSVILSIIDPAGAGNNYNIDYSIRQQNQDLDPVQHITGTSVAGKLNRIANFHFKS
jgi:hypothetical protein